MHAQSFSTPAHVGVATVPDGRSHDADAAPATPENAPDVALELRCGILVAPAVGAAFGLLLPAGLSAEILRATPVCSMPNTSPWFAGLVNVRGNLVPVFDLLRYFGLGHAAATGRRADVVTVGAGANAFAIPVKTEPRILRVGGSPVQATAPRELRDFTHAAHLDDGIHWYEFHFDRWLALVAADASAPSPHLTSSGEST